MLSRPARCVWEPLQVFLLLACRKCFALIASRCSNLCRSIEEDLAFRWGCLHSDSAVEVPPSAPSPSAEPCLQSPLAAQFRLQTTKRMSVSDRKLKKKKETDFLLFCFSFSLPCDNCKTTSQCLAPSKERITELKSAGHLNNPLWGLLCFTSKSVLWALSTVKNRKTKTDALCSLSWCVQGQTVHRGQ